MIEEYIAKQEAFESLLRERFPSLFREDILDEQRNFCGIGCPEGWRPVVIELCALLHWYNTKNPPRIIVRRWNHLFYKGVSWVFSKIAKKTNPFSGRVFSGEEAEKIREGKAYKKHIKWYGRFVRFSNKQMKTVEVPFKQLKIDQIKEKFGSLRFYYSHGDPRAHGAICLAERLCNNICQETGSFGAIKCVNQSRVVATLEPEYAKKAGYSTTNF
jgi:hypothetical protein